MRVILEHGGKRQRRSKQREIILEELRKLKSHPRSDELYAIVRGRLPNVSLGTVYRNLNELQRQGKALEIYCGDFVRYDGNVSPHDHFLCRVCRKVWDFETEDSIREREKGQDKFIEDSGFKVEGKYTMFFGICSGCRSASEEAVKMN